MATTIGGSSITHGDGSVQKTATVVPQIQVFTSPGTFTIPSSTTRIKVTVVGGGGGSPSSAGGGVGASGGTSSFGSYLSSTGGSGTSPGTSPGATFNILYSDKNNGSHGTLAGVYGSGGQTGAPLSPTMDTFGTPGFFYAGGKGGAGISVINAPFPVTSVPVTIGAGGGGGGALGPNASGVNGSPGGSYFYVGGGGGGGAGGYSTGAGGSGGNQGGQGGQPGTATAVGGGGGPGYSEGTSAGYGGPGGFSGIVIVEY